MRRCTRSKTVSLSFTALIAAVVPLSTAHAQSVTEMVPVRVKAGVLQTSGSTARAFGSRHIGILADVSFSRSMDTDSFTIGYFEGRRGGQRMRTIPALVTRSSSSASPLGNVSGFFTGSGFGAYFVDAGTGFKTKFGTYFGAGFRVPGGFSAEAQYHYVAGKVNGFTPNGIAILIGKRY